MVYTFREEGCVIERPRIRQTLEWIVLVGSPLSPTHGRLPCKTWGKEKQGKYLLPMDDSLSRTGREEKSGK